MKQEIGIKQQAEPPYVPEDRTIHNHHYEDLKSNMSWLQFHCFPQYLSRDNALKQTTTHFSPQILASH
jgi:hypothetical protein